MPALPPLALPYLAKPIPAAPRLPCLDDPGRAGPLRALPCLPRLAKPSPACVALPIQATPIRHAPSLANYQLHLWPMFSLINASLYYTHRFGYRLEKFSQDFVTLIECLEIALGCL